MAEWKIIEQLTEIEKRLNETYNLLVEIGGVASKAESPTNPQEPISDIDKARLIIERLTETSQENLELVRLLHEKF